LKALLDADVINRSAALVAAIDRALPLYVQTPALRDAHTILGQEHVCLISGRPGIGKTTLARMLVADAVKQGHEPIEVSYDVEEAWRLLDSEVPQIFYYDDFLGTTTLGELTKNEDQRLVSFIAEVAARPNTRFVLTTREYILQQAHALYDSFARSKLDAKKFFLTLDSYRSIDRARILYNHVFHSETLPGSARTDLARRGAYRRIVDSDLFNPRLIEAITSGYGKAEAEDGVDFVDYAVSILNDPETLWRRVFDNQLASPERTLLYALASMPNSQMVGDLRVTFAVLAESTEPDRDPDLDRALEILDDSFVVTWMEDGQHILRFVNPSVEDFIASRIRGSARLLRVLLEAAVYFDQVVTLTRILREVEGVAESGEEIVSVAIGLLDSESIRWNRFEDSFHRRKLIRVSETPEARLGFMVGVLAEAEVSNALLEEVWLRVEQLPSAWSARRVDPDEALHLASAMIEGETGIEPSQAFLTALRRQLLEAVHGPYGHGRIIELYQLAPQAFESNEFQSIAADFVADAKYRLEDDPWSIGSLDELNRFGTVAEEFGMPLEESLLERAIEEYGEEEPEERRDWEDIDYDPDDDDRRAERAARRQMDALFDRLADEPAG
jgi:hypothetical protein